MERFFLKTEHPRLLLLLPETTKIMAKEHTKEINCRREDDSNKILEGRKQKKKW